MLPAGTKRDTRPDLSNRLLLSLLTITLIGGLLAGWLMHGIKPGEPIAQLAAIAGTAFLLVPVGFFFFKRSARRVSTPHWFAAHALSAYVGAILIIAHVAGGSWSKPAVLVFLALMFLVVHGTYARAVTSSKLPQVFAATSASFNFGPTLRIDRQALTKVIQDKEKILQSLHPGASEATYSPQLSDWLSQPALSWRYQQLVRAEEKLVGARERAGASLRWWRTLHLIVAVIFVIGLIAHLVVMLLFAGYAAGDGSVYWWHLADWGRSNP